MLGKFIAFMLSIIVVFIALKGMLADEGDYITLFSIAWVSLIFNALCFRTLEILNKLRDITVKDAEDTVILNNE